MEMSRIVATALLLTSTAAAAPALAVRLSSAQIRKGQPIKIYLDITAQELLAELRINPIPPTGFVLKPENPPPATLTGGSTFTAVYTAEPPSQRPGLPGTPPCHAWQGGRHAAPGLSWH